MYSQQNQQDHPTTGRNRPARGPCPSYHLYRPPPLRQSNRRQQRRSQRRNRLRLRHRTPPLFTIPTPRMNSRSGRIGISKRNRHPRRRETFVNGGVDIETDYSATDYDDPNTTDELQQWKDSKIYDKTSPTAKKPSPTAESTEKKTTPPSPYSATVYPMPRIIHRF